MNMNDVFLHGQGLVTERVFKRLALDLTRLLYQVGFDQVPEKLANEYLLYQTKIDKIQPGLSAKLLKEAEDEVKGISKKSEELKENKQLTKLEAKAKKLNAKLDNYSGGNYQAPKSLKIDFVRTMMNIESINPERADQMMDEFRERAKRHVNKVMNTYYNTNIKY